jgi:hypothetical protein
MSGPFGAILSICFRGLLSNLPFDGQVAKLGNKENFCKGSFLYYIRVKSRVGG